MVKFYKSLFFLTLTVSLYAESSYTLQNSNFTIDNGSFTYNYNRLRLDHSYYNDNYFSKFIADGVNYYSKSYTESAEFDLLKSQSSDTPISTQSRFKDYGDGEIQAKVYRLYGGYGDGKNRVVVGLQNITMGVGRFWNPTNLFNPKNIYALEPDETFGVIALSYTRYINDTTSLNVVSSIKEDETLKYALRYKTFLKYADLAVDLLYSDNTKMIGYEAEANLFDTGVEVRSEGAHIRSHLQNTQDETKLTQAVLGAEYGFVNGVNLTVESLFSSKSFSETQIITNLDSEILQNMTNSKFYAGASLSYTFNIFLDASVLYIDSFNSEDPFVSASMTYTLNDFNSFVLGVLSKGEQTYYLKYQLAF